MNHESKEIEMLSSTDRNIIDNLRFRWPELRDVSARELLRVYRDFSISEDFGNNDEKFPSWFAEMRRGSLREISEAECDVIEAACNLIEAEEGGHYGPMGAQIKAARKRLWETVADLAAENDGKWRRPE